MKLTINIPKDTEKQLLELISEWRKLSPGPLTNYERLRRLEKDMVSQLTYAVLHDDTLDTFVIAE